MKLLYLVCHFRLLIVLVDGYCGFPGRPKNGQVTVDFDDSLVKATYTCPTNSSNSSSKKLKGEATRICSNGTWNGIIPRCGEQVDLKYYYENYGNLTDKNRSSCDLVRGCQSIILNFTQQFFIWRVEIIAKKFNSSAEEKNFFQKSSWLIQAAGQPTTQFERVERNFSSRTPFPGLNNIFWDVMEECNSINLTFLGSGSLQICEIEVYAFPDDCDKPEEPINGRVKSTSTSAIYHCDPGYQLTGAANRSCIHGRWSGDPPKCVKEFCTPTYESIVIDSVLGVLIILLIAFIVYDRRDKSCRTGNAGLIGSPGCTSQSEGVPAVYENIIAIRTNSEPQYVELQLGNGMRSNRSTDQHNRTNDLTFDLNESENIYAMIVH